MRATACSTSTATCRACCATSTASSPTWMPTSRRRCLLHAYSTPYPIRSVKALTSTASSPTWTPTSRRRCLSHACGFGHCTNNDALGPDSLARSTERAPSHLHHMVFITGIIVATAAVFWCGVVLDDIAVLCRSTSQTLILAIWCATAAPPILIYCCVSGL